jgi:signal transduction histidine kinase
MSRALMITAADGLEGCIAALRDGLNLDVDVVTSRRAATQALTRREFAVVIVDQALAEGDPEGADLVWKQSGLAVPVQANFALSSPARVVREVRAALQRREQEMALSLRAAAAAVDGEVKNAVTAMLLESQLALQGEDLPPAAREKLATVAQLAETLRRKLEAAEA